MHHWSHFESWIVNDIFQFSWCVIWKFQTTCSGSSRCSFRLRIAQKSSSPVKEKIIFRLSFDSRRLSAHFEKLSFSRIPTRWGCLEAQKECPIRKYSGECFAPFQFKFTLKLKLSRFFAVTPGRRLILHQYYSPASNALRVIPNSVCDVCLRSPQNADWSCTDITLRHILLYES